MSDDQFLSELSTLNEISKVVNSTLDLDVVLKAVVHLTKTRMGVDVCSVYLLDDGQVVLRATDGLAPVAVGRVRLALGQGITGWTASAGIPHAVSDASNHERFCHIPGIGEEDYKSMLSVPLISRGTIIGVINVQTRERREFSQLEQNFLSSIASHIAGAIRNAQLYVEASRALHELTTLNEVSKVISSTLDLPELLNRVAVICTHLVSAEGAVLRLTDDTSQRLDAVAAYGMDSLDCREDLMEYEVRLAREVLQEKRPRTIVTTFNCPQGQYGFLCVPMSVKGQIDGTISAFASLSEREEFTLGDRRLMVTLASQAGIAIQNARLFDSVRKAQLQLKEAHELLVHQEKLAALGQMAAGVAHELRNPLVSIGGFSRRLAKNNTDAEKVTVYADRITREVGRLEKLIEDILFYASPRKLDLQPIDLNELLDEMKDHNIRQSREKNGRYIVSIPRSQSQVRGDVDSLRRVFMNLIDNAFQAIDERGEVRIATRQRDDGRINIEISDSGKGIEHSLLPLIFDPFYTTKAGGTGLGLSIVKNIVIQHGGAILVESDLGKGSTFRFDLEAQTRTPEE